MKFQLFAALACIGAIANAQVDVLGRETTISYQYLYGGGPFVWQGNPSQTFNSLISGESKQANYQDTQAGSWAGLTFNVSVFLDLSSTWSITGPLTNARRMQWSAFTDTNSTASGDIPTSQIQSDGPGNYHFIRFDVYSPTRYDISGSIAVIDAGILSNYVNIQKFDGFTWGHTFHTWFSGNGLGPFTGSGVLEPGQYRVISQIGNRSFGNQVNHSDGNYDLKFSETVTPSSVVVRRGRVDAGTVANLGSQNDQALRMCKFLVPNQQVAPIEVEVVGTSSILSPSTVTFSMLSKMAVSGSFSQQLDLYNYATASFSNTATRLDGVDTTYRRRYLDATGTQSQFVSPTGEVRARYSIRQTGPAGAAIFCHETDNASWMITP